MAGFRDLARGAALLFWARFRVLHCVVGFAFCVCVVCVGAVSRALSPPGGRVRGRCVMCLFRKLCESGLLST